MYSLYLILKLTEVWDFLKIKKHKAFCDYLVGLRAMNGLENVNKPINSKHLYHN